MSKTFGTYEVQLAEYMLDGVAYVIHFPNGWGASIVRNRISYGGRVGKWELAVLDSMGDLSYETPITDDVVGWLDESEVADYLDRIAALPAGPEPDPGHGSQTDAPQVWDNRRLVAAEWYAGSALDEDASLEDRLRLAFKAIEEYAAVVESLRPPF